MKTSYFYKRNSTKIFYVTVDDEDFHFLEKYRWGIAKFPGSKTYYVKAKLGNTTIYLHQLICPVPPGSTVDHRNGDGLDNRKENLREATRSQQRANCDRFQNAASKYKGVNKRIYKNGSIMYRAKLSANGVKYDLGQYKTEMLAAKAYNRAAIEHFGDFARLNIIEEIQ